MDDLDNLDLPSIVTKLHNMGNVEENLAPWKRALCLLVARVTDNENTSSDVATEREVCLDFINHCLGTAPQMFHGTFGLNTDGCLNSPAKVSVPNEGEKNFDLAYWLTNRLVYMLTKLKEGTCLVEKSMDILINLAQNVALKDSSAFSKLCNEYVVALSNLCEFSEQIYNTDTEDLKMELKEFYVNECQTSDGSGEANMLHKPLIFESQEICESLQIVFTKILLKLVVNIFTFAHCDRKLDARNLLWTSISSQLEWGEVELKTVTLRLAAKLLLYGIYPSGQSLDYFVDCLVGLIDLLCSGFSDCEGDYNALEEGTTEALNHLIKYCTRSDVPHNQCHQVFYTVAKGIMKILTSHGSMHLRTVCLRQCLYDILLQICNIENGMAIAQTFDEERKELNRVTIEELGSCADSEYCVKWLRNSVLIDVYSKYDSSERSSSICTLDSILGVAEIDHTVEVEEKEERILSKRRKLALCKGQNAETDTEDRMSYRKRKVPSAKSPNSEEIVVANSSVAKSYTAVLVNNKLLDLQEFVRVHDEVINYQNVFEGVKTCLEVLVWIAVKIVDQENMEGSSLRSSGFLNESNVLSLVNMWKNIIISRSDAEAVDVLTYCYDKIVDGIGCLLFANDVLKLTNEIFQTMTWILSIHWLPAELSWKDLRPAEHKDVTRICNSVADKLNSNMLKDCVFVLAFIPKEIACKWRMHVLKVAMNDTDDQIRNSAVESFPYFLYHMGPNSNHLVYDVLHGLVKDKSTEVLSSLAGVLGPLSCVVSRKVMLNRNLKNESPSSSIRCIEFKCVSCDNIDISDDTPSTRDRPKTVDPSMFFPFIELIQSSQNVKVRRCMVHSLEKLFGHITVRSNNDGSASVLVSQCMHLLSDPDNTTRAYFCKPLRCLISKGGSETILPAERLIIEQMKRVVRSARNSKNNALMESVLRTTGYLAKHAKDYFLVLMVIVLLDNICKPLSLLVGAVAHNQLKLVAKAKNIELCHLFVQFGKKFCEVVVDNMYESEETNSEIEPLDIVKEVVDAFEFESVSQFFRKTEPYLLPHLVKKGNAVGTKLIKIVAKQLGDPNHKGPVYRNIGHIYCHIVCSTESDEFTKLCKYLEEIFEKPLVEFLSAGSNMEFDLLLRLASHKNQVLRGFRFYLSRLDEQIAEEVSTDEGIARVLQPKLLGMFVHLDNYLNNGTIQIHEKKKAYESMVTLIELMGPSRISAVRVRMMTTLKIGLKFKDWGFPHLCCRTWNCFVRSIDIGSVGGMLAQIIVNLLPLLNQMPKQVADIFNYLIVENRKELSNHFHELYFIPDIPELKDVNAVLKHYIEGRYSVKDVKVQIESLLKGISHESVDVRQHALSKLQTLLHTNKSALHTYILGSENVHPIISRIVHSLLAGCRDSSPSLRVLYGSCLGELGAVDPGRLQQQINKSKEDLHTFQATVDEPSFCFDLICKLSQAYLRASERSIQDLVAYAIQSLIQLYEITDDPDANTIGYKIWRKFPEEVQEVITPLRTSKYVMTIVYTWDNLHKPIYRGGKKGFTFDSWVCTLTSYLGSCIAGEKQQKVFEVCRGVLKSNSQIALYLLPYVIVHVLLENNEVYLTELVSEMLSVLNHAKDPQTSHSNSSNLSHLSTQTIFSVLDHLIKWTRHRVMVLSTMAATSAARGRSSSALSDISYKNDSSYQRIKGFLDQIPLDTLALASFNCGAYTRSLMHYEQFIKSKQEDLRVEEHLDFMQKLFVALDEPDGVAGITAIKQVQPTLREQIMAYESVGQLSDALVCYDRAVKLDPEDLALRHGLLKSRLALGELNSAMEQVNGIIVEKPEWTEQLNEFRVEAAWKLGQWDKLQGFLKYESQGRKWNVCLGKIFLAARNGDREDLNKQINLSRNELMGPLCAASMEFGSYQRGYEYIVQLHMLNEMEQGLRTLFDLDCDADPTQKVPKDMLLKQWEQRLQLTQPTFRVQEPILNLRRAILSLAREVKGMDQLDQEIGHSWLQSVRIARDCGLVQAAHSSLLSASSYHLPEYCIENAKWLWHRGDFDRAQDCLEKAIDEYYPDRAKFVEGSGSEEERFACARVLLLLGTYREQTASLESTAMMRQFKEVSKVYGKWEDSYFTCAKYFDKVMTNVITEKPEKRGDFIIHVITNLGQSLQFGSQYIYQSMPRMLSLWLDYGADLTEPEKYNRNESMKQAMEGVLSILNNKIGKFTKELPAYQFLTAFPQLISRICHTHPDVFSRLKDMISNLLIAYPHQAMWGIMAVSKSSYQMRNKRCQEIFYQAKSMKPELHKFLLDAQKLTERLLDLCNRSVEHSVTTLSITQHFKPLQRLVDDPAFSSIMIPLQSLMTVTLPTNTLAASEKHNPFPGEPVYIRGLEDTVELLSSLQRPKKVNLRGSDGRNFIVLCKPKDDLRKDARLMEFNSVVNKCLHKDPEASRRDLKIRTFAVTPLNEECGMLEWVPNTASLRYILNKLYRERGVYTTSKDLRSMQLQPKVPLHQKLEMFRNKLLPRHIAIFSEWFLKTFPDPTSWYNARLAYCRTAAVMSMVGYILGLGDRHGENILLDSTTGDCVHVDFNCLFNKGETFDYPEIVPFRLTHNMIDAMGPLGYEGVFRRACEVCLRVMRDQSDSLMSVLKSFIYDPLVEWSKPTKGRSNPTDSGEIRNEKAQTHVSNIESRLRGIVKTKSKLKGLPLSVEGHVNHLIKEATDENNLCQMYIGWAPYL